MIKYGDLVQYIKDNHVSWNTDLFDVLRGFFNQYYQPSLPSPTISQQVKVESLQQEITFPKIEDFQPPASGEYTSDDLLNLFST